MKQPKPTSQTIDLILTAAERVVLRDSVMSLTLEAVAREANLSKGGVLYHFATKEALIQAMLERLIQYYERAIAQQQRDDAAPGRWTPTQNPRPGPSSCRGPTTHGAWLDGVCSRWPCAWR